MRQCQLGNGETECITCGETSLFNQHCAECGKITCSKCGMACTAINPHTQNHGHDKKRQAKGSARVVGGGLSSSLSSSSSVTSLLTATFTGGLHGSGGCSGIDGVDGKKLIWLCKIFREQRETWKKSGAWFFKVGPFFKQCRLEIGSLSV